MPSLVAEREDEIAKKLSNWEMATTAEKHKQVNSVLLHLLLLIIIIIMSIIFISIIGDIVRGPNYFQFGSWVKIVCPTFVVPFSALFVSPHLFTPFFQSVKLLKIYFFVVFK